VLVQEFYSEAEAKIFVRTLASAMAYCHKHGVVHRDLKVRLCLCEKFECGMWWLVHWHVHAHLCGCVLLCAHACGDRGGSVFVLGRLQR